MSRKNRLILALAVLAFVVSTAWNVGTRINTQTETTDSIDSVIEAIEIQCHEEESIRLQYKIRAEDLVTLSEVVKGLVQVAVPITNGPAQDAFQAFIPEINNVIHTIHILPLPDCEARGNRLRKTLPE